MKDRVDAKRPRTADQLERFAKKAWVDLVNDKGQIGRLYGSMPSRLAEVIRNGGGKVSY